MLSNKLFDIAPFIGLLAEDITLCSDGGGKVTAALKQLYGTGKIARFLLAIRRHRPTNFTSQIAEFKLRLRPTQKTDAMSGSFWLPGNSETSCFKSIACRSAKGSR